MIWSIHNHCFDLNIKWVSNNENSLLVKYSLWECKQFSYDCRRRHLVERDVSGKSLRRRDVSYHIHLVITLTTKWWSNIYLEYMLEIEMVIHEKYKEALNQLNNEALSGNKLQIEFNKQHACPTPNVNICILERNDFHKLMQWNKGILPNMYSIVNSAIFVNNTSF